MPVIPLAIFVFGVGLMGTAVSGSYGGRLVFRSPTPHARWAIVGVSALFGALASGAPTHLTPVNVLAQAGLAAAVTGAAFRAHRVTLAAVAVVAAVVFLVEGFRNPAHSFGLVFAMLGAGSALAAWLMVRRSSALCAVYGALVAQGLLRLPTTLPSRTPSVVAAAGFLAIVGSAWPHLRTRTRRRVARATLGFAGAFTLAGAGGTLALGLAARDASRGVNGAREALRLAREVDTAGSNERLHVVARDLRKVRHGVRAWWALPGRAVPVLSQHLVSLDRLATSAAAVSLAASDATAAVDVRRLRVAQGTVDLGALEQSREPIDRLDDALGRLRTHVQNTRGPWLLTALTRRVDRLDDDLQRAGRDTAAIRRAVDVLPGMLGAREPRRYLLIVQTPSEARGSGGIVGNYGEITAEKGQIRLTRFGRAVELTDFNKGKRNLVGDPDYVARYLPYQADVWWQNMTMSPDFPSVALAMANMYPQSGGAPVDGVLSVDPYALAAVLRITGPITVAGWPEPITADNAAETVLFQQYVRFPDQDPTLRAQLLGTVAQTVWSRLTSTSLPPPDAFGSSLGPAARGRHIQFWASRAPEQDYIRSLGADGAVPAVQGDGVGVVINNGSGNKIEWFLRRRVAYQATFDPATGAVKSLLRVTLTNEAPSSGLPAQVIGNDVTPPLAIGTSRLFVSLYSPLAATAARVNGVSVPFQRQTELGRNVYSVWVDVASKSSLAIELDLAGALAVSGGRYRVDVIRQPLVEPDQLEIAVKPTPGWILTPAAADDSTGRRQGDGWIAGPAPQPANQAFELEARRGS